jgi:hypothetical protein
MYTNSGGKKMLQLRCKNTDCHKGAEARTRLPAGRAEKMLRIFPFCLRGLPEGSGQVMANFFVKYFTLLVKTS